jgi:hypothetical protein
MYLGSMFNSYVSSPYSIKRTYFGLVLSGVISDGVSPLRSPISSNGARRGRPCAHWNGTSHWPRALINCEHCVRVSSSPNLIAPKKHYNKVMARKEMKIIFSLVDTMTRQ